MRQWHPAALAVHEAVKLAFDPKGLLNPGKKLAHLPVLDGVSDPARTDPR
jgi:hypothetical protein